MIRVDATLEEQFKTAKDGRRLFFPFRGCLLFKSLQRFIIPSVAEYGWLFKAERIWLGFIYRLGAVLAFFCAIRAYSVTHSYLLGFLAYCLTWVTLDFFHYAWLRIRCSTLEKTHEFYY